MALSETYTHLTTLFYDDGSSIDLPESSLTYGPWSSIKNAIDFDNDMRNLTHAAGATESVSEYSTSRDADFGIFRASPDRQSHWRAISDIIATFTR